MNYLITTSQGEELYHHGILGQKWGVRRYQNEDGTRTSLGKAHERELAGAGSLFERNETQSTKDFQYKNGQYQMAKVSGWDNKQKYREEKNAAFDKAKSDFKANKTFGQKVANAIINGPIGAGTYNNMRARGASAFQAGAVAQVSALLGGPIGQLAMYYATKRG